MTTTAAEVKVVFLFTILQDQLMFKLITPIQLSYSCILAFFFFFFFLEVASFLVTTAFNFL